MVSQIQRGQNPMKRITERVNEDVPVATYVSYSSAMMIPEKAGGSDAATTSIFKLKGSMWNRRPRINTTAGMTTIFMIEPSTACQLIEILIAERVIPAAKTAIEAFAFAMRSNEGLR